MRNGDSTALCYNDATTRRDAARDIRGRCDSVLHNAKDSLLYLRDYKRGINGPTRWFRRQV